MQTVRDLISDLNEEVLFLSPEYFDEAILGCAERCGMLVVAYSRNKVLDLLIEHEDMEYEDALEHFEYNILGSWVGENTPVFIAEFFDDASSKGFVHRH